MWGTLLLGHCVSSVDLQWGVFLTALIVAEADNIGEVNELGDDENEL